MLRRFKMAFVRNHLTVLSVTSLWRTALLAVLFSSFRADAITLDWNVQTWSAAQGFSKSFELDSNNPGNDVTITVSGDTSFALANTPQDTTTLNGGLGASEHSLLLAGAPFTSDSQRFIVTITFNYAAGVDFADFTLFDIDKSTGSGSTWTDQIRNIRGINSLTGTTNGANITAVGSQATLAGTAGNTNQTITGNAINNDANSGGNATIDYGGKIITSITFEYGNAPGTPVDSIQWIGVDEIHYRPKVPEVNPALVAMVVCGLAIGVRARRRSTPSGKNSPA